MKKWGINFSDGIQHVLVKTLGLSHHADMLVRLEDRSKHKPVKSDEKNLPEVSPELGPN